MGVKLFMFIPCYREMISAQTFDTSHALMAGLMQKGMQAHIGRYSWFDIAEMRNIALSYWYDCMPTFTHLLFVDDDMGFPPEVVTDMIAFNEPIVGALYRKKCENYDWAASGLPPGTGEVRGMSFLEVEGLGCGCFLIRRDAIDLMVEKLPHLIRDHVVIGDFKISGLKRTLGFFDAIMSPEGKVAEDISFCRRWREVGGKVWASAGHVITHVGQHEFKGGYADWRMTEHLKKQHEDNILLASKPEFGNGQSAA